MSDGMYVCLTCNHRFTSEKLSPCSECQSFRVIEDQLYLVPESHNLFVCTCKNVYFKIARDPAREKLYFKCVCCNQNINVEDLQ